MATYSINMLVDQFEHNLCDVNNKVLELATIYEQACVLVGEKQAYEVFSSRFQQLTKNDFALLLRIAKKEVLSQVFTLPDFVRNAMSNLPETEQARFFGFDKHLVVRFATEKPVYLATGEMNRSDWRTVFNRETGRLRLSENAQRAYIRAKKKEIAEFRRWRVEGQFLSVVRPCKIGLEDLKAIIEEMSRNA